MTIKQLKYKWRRLDDGSRIFSLIGGMAIVALIIIILGCKVVAVPTEFTVTVYWTAPGDNGNTGTAAVYDLRYGTSTITDANWASAENIPIPAPMIAGTAESASIIFLAESDITVYFAIKTIDTDGNISALSNVVPYLTPDIIPPAAIVDLRNTP